MPTLCWRSLVKELTALPSIWVCENLQPVWKGSASWKLTFGAALSAELQPLI
jgi:hypothetical protein